MLVQLIEVECDRIKSIQKSKLGKNKRQYKCFLFVKDLNSAGEELEVWYQKEGLILLLAS